MQNGEKLPKNAAVITIDDGYRDAYEIAFPLLKKYNVPATLFAVTGFLDCKIWVWTDKIRFIASRMKTEKLTIKIGQEQIELKNKTPEEVFFLRFKS